ncbi:uncharacterized protein LJ206_005212 [Theristicus caerulescens]
MKQFKRGEKNHLYPWVEKPGGGCAKKKKKKEEEAERKTEKPSDRGLAAGQIKHEQHGSRGSGGRARRRRLTCPAPARPRRRGRFKGPGRGPAAPRLPPRSAAAGGGPAAPPHPAAGLRGAALRGRGAAPPPPLPLHVGAPPPSGTKAAGPGPGPPLGRARRAPPALRPRAAAGSAAPSPPGAAAGEALAVRPRGRAGGAGSGGLGASGDGSRLEYLNKGKQHDIQDPGSLTSSGGWWKLRSQKQLLVLFQIPSQKRCVLSVQKVDFISANRCSCHLHRTASAHSFSLALDLKMCGGRANCLGSLWTK